MEYMKKIWSEFFKILLIPEADEGKILQEAINLRKREETFIIAD